jgi:phosphatidylserine/phosphatidylglycerophosphate/cardiolipin synthase-like enzyme
VGVEDWFLTAAERDNPDSELPVWSAGNDVRFLVHGTAYFERLVDAVEGMRRGDHLFLAGWRGDPDQLLRPGGPTVEQLLTSAAERGVLVKGLVWRSHLSTLQFSAEENRALAEEVADVGGQILLDHRVRVFGSHHQKFVVLRHPGRAERDVAFAGGIDLCHSRRDDAEHHGDPQPVGISPRYGELPPWHDTQLELRGPVVGALDLVFRERWRDPTMLRWANPVAMLRDRLSGLRVVGGPLPPAPAPPAECGPHLVQLLRTYPVKPKRYPFAPTGERSVARGYTKAVRRARRIIYMEDQYMWSAEVARLLADALRRNPDLHLVVVVPRHPDVDGRLALPPNLIGRKSAIDVCRRSDPDRVHVFDVENHAGTPVYVHAKVCVVDDVWASVGSANFNRRSWTHDSELSCAVLDPTADPREPRDPAGLGDGARVFAREVRLTLLREHLDRAADGSEDGDLLDPADAVRAVEASAAALDAWYEGGCQGPRPPGRLRRHVPEELSTFTRVWATWPYRVLYDPDGRTVRERRAHTW